MAPKNVRGKPAERQYRMTVAGQLFKHLGLQMYAGAVPAISELISNAYDAMATNVWITIPTGRPIQQTDEIVVKDDGHGMNYEECNSLYLSVGMNRRATGSEWTNAYDGLKPRKVQGRKGIGKLAGFGISDRIEIRTVKGTKVSRFALDFNALTKSQSFADTDGYAPEALPGDGAGTREKPGTAVTLSQLKISRAIDEDHFKRGLARRLLVLDKNFKVHVNGKPISRQEIPFQFRFPAKSGEWETADLGDGRQIQWWAGFCKDTIPDEQQRGFVVYVRGKLAQSGGSLCLACLARRGHHDPMLLLLTLVLASPPGADDPVVIVRTATRAVEGDSVAAVAARWRARTRRNPGDRDAALGLATLSLLTYDYAAAERAYRALYTGGDRAADRVAAHARLGYGHALSHQAKFPEADEAYRLAADALAALSDTAGLVDALAARALVVARIVGRAAGDSLLERAAPLAAAAGGTTDARYRCARAVLLVARGAPDAALEARAGATAAGRAGEPRTRGACLTALAQHLMNRGVTDSAKAVVLEALAVQTAARDRRGLAAVLQRWGWYLSALGDHGEAREFLARAVREGEASGSWSVVGWAENGLAGVAWALGDLPSGVRHAARAAELLEAQGDQAGLTVSRGFEGDFARAAGDLAAARSAYLDVLARHERAGNAAGIVGIRTVLAKLAMQENDWGGAAGHLDTARRTARERDLTGWDAGLTPVFGALALRQGQLVQAESLFTAALAVRQTEARRYALRIRLAETAARRGNLARAESLLVEAGDALDFWRATLSAIELRRLAFQVADDPGDPDLGLATVIAALAAGGRAEPAFSQAERRRARELLDQLLRAGSAATPGAADPGTPQVARALPDHAALLEFVTGRGNEPTTLFVVTRAGVAAHRLPSVDSLDPDVRRFATLVESGGNPRPLGTRLGQAVLGPALAGLDPEVTRLIVVPDDVLHRLPFDALVLPDGRFLLERYAVSLVPSAAVAAHLWARPPSAAPRPLLALGDPAFPDPRSAAVSPVSPAPPVATAVYADAFTRAGGMPRLRASGDEVRAAARLLGGGEVHVREEASEARVKRTATAEYRVVHFATHAVVDERSAARTALALAADGDHDGYLGPGDLAALRLDASLVVLSACRTAGGVMIRGEGIEGLTSLLLQVGARAVVATLWRIPDRSTTRFVQRFYRSLAAGVPVGDALRVAKLDALRRGAPAGEWAAFALIGNGTVTVGRSGGRGDGQDGQGGQDGHDGR
jgi:tetratricopeptide (TPR) repeat protein